MDYLELLNNSYDTERLYSGCSPESRLEYLGDDIFEFTTYDGEMSVLFAKKAIEVCIAITERTTFEYIKDPENYRWYLLMVNMPFFAERIEWGSSVRGAWWHHKVSFRSFGLWNGGEQMAEEMTFNQEEWKAFIRAVIEFASIL